MAKKAEKKEAQAVTVTVLVGCEDSYGRRWEPGDEIADGVMKKEDLAALVSMGAMAVNEQAGGDD